MRRLESYQVLVEVLVKHRHAHLVLKEQQLPPQDQAFVSALVYTTLQHSLFLEYQYEDLIDKKLPIEVQIIIKMGCAQFFKMDSIPDYALVNESVDLCKQVGKKRYAGVVNAVLKKIVQRGEREIHGDALTQASIRESMPLWIMKLLSKQYSETFALDYARYCQSIKPTYVRFNTLKPLESVDFNLVFEQDGNWIAQPELFRSSYLSDGYCLVQDINSQKVVERMNIVEDMTILDCCCGPGTKTVQIANKLRNSGHIDGVELYESRSLATESLMERCNVNNSTIHTSDVLEYKSDVKYDRILLDAPCSGLGVLSHKHDLRYHILPSELDELVILQAKMLDHVADMLAENGMLVYSTCTLNRKENEKQVEAFIERHPDFEVISSETLIPHETQGDGFYIAQLMRK